MSTPDKMDCLKDQCRSPLACSGFGYCRERNFAAAKEYEEGLRACRALGITDPFGEQFGTPTTPHRNRP